jgi:hypothetical protein
LCSQRVVSGVRDDLDDLDDSRLFVSEKRTKMRDGALLVAEKTGSKVQRHLRPVNGAAFLADKVERVRTVGPDFAAGTEIREKKIT